MALNQHKTDIDLISSIDALTEILSESRIAAEPAFRDRPMSTNDPVPDNPFWTPKNCYLHALNRFHKRWPNAEGIISSDAKAAVDYAVNVLDDVWPDDENGRHAEKMISRDPSRALWYAKMVKGRWEEIEPAMASKANWAYEYAKSVLEHRWDGPHAKDAEVSITSDPYIATLYCVDLKYSKRYDNPRIERMILDSIYGALYAHTVAPKLTIQEINQEVDENLKALNAGQNIDFSEVFEESWESWTDAATLKPDPKSSRPIVLVYYAQEKLKKRWQEAEPYILEKCRRNESIDEIHHLFVYAVNVIKPYDKKNPSYDRGRWLEAEPIIKTDSHVAYNYALAILKERWQDPEVELHILNSDSAKYYAEYVAKTSEDELREDVEQKIYDLNRHDDIDLSDTVEEAIDRFLPLIAEAVVKRDYSTMTPSLVYTYAITDYKTKKLHGEEYEPDPKAEAVMMKDPGAACYYARDVINDGKCLGIRWKEAEPIIKSEPYWAYAYAKDVLGGRWRDAEHIIKSDTYIAYLYARYIIKPSDPSDYDNDKGRWDLETESRILENHDPVIPENDSEKESEICELYANNVAEMSIEEFKNDIDNKISGMRASDEIDLSGTTEEAIDKLLPLIAETQEGPNLESSHANKLVSFAEEARRRWTIAEPYLLEKCSKGGRSPVYYLYRYALKVIAPFDKENHNYDRGRWIKAEPIIGRNPEIAYCYARDILGERWQDPTVELNILNSSAANLYAVNVAETSEDELRADVQRKLYHLNRHDGIDLSDTTEEDVISTQPIIVESREDQIRAMALYFIALDKKNAKEEGLTPEQEKEILKAPEYAYKYAKYVLEDEWVEAEPILLTNLYWAYNYAKNVIQGRWEAAEPLIMAGEFPEFALSYALDISKIRLNPLIELRFIKFAENDEEGEDWRKYENLDDYAEYVAKMSLEDLKADAEMKISDLTSGDDTDLSDTVEEAIYRLMPLISENELDPVNQDVMRRTAVECYVHANYVLKKPWPKGEPKILTHPYASFLYAKEVIEGPWPKAEEIISTHAKSARLYAQYVLKRRFIEGEDAIKKDPEEAYYYAENVLKPFDSIEKNPSYNNGRWEDPKTELLILNAPWELPYAERIAGMTRKDLIAELEYKMKDISPDDDKDLTDTTEEAIDRLLPLITESEEEPDFEKMTPHDAYDYVCDYKRKHEDSPWREPDPRAARIIMKDPHLATSFATFFINQGRSLKIRWREAEPIIKTKASSAYNYAKSVIGGRWREAEDVIKKDTFYAYFYALEVIKPSGRKNYDYENGRWDLETETRILQDHDFIVPDEDATEESEVCELYALRVAEMSLSDLIADVDEKTKDIRASDNIDLSDTTEEDVINTLPVILETISNEDYIRAINLYHDAKDKKQANQEGLTPEEEGAILKAPEYAYKYAAYVLEREWPEAESIILTVPHWASKYAENVVKGRWEAAEPIMMQCPRRAISYALNASQMRLNPAIELKLFELAGRYEGLSNLRLHEQLVEYAANVAKMSLEDLEADVKMKLSAITDGDDIDLSSTVEEAIDKLMPLIMESKLPDPKSMTPNECYNYAYNFTKRLEDSAESRKWLEEAEQVIKHDPEMATWYAINVLNYAPTNYATAYKVRFKIAEDFIKMSPKWAFIYARDIYSKSGLRGFNRWEDAEPFIFKDEKYAYFYSQYVAHMPMEQVQADVDKRNAEMLPDEFKDLSGTTEESVERLMPLICESHQDDESQAMEAFFYARDVIGGPSPERESILKKDPFWAVCYANQLSLTRWDPVTELKILEMGNDNLDDHEGEVVWVYANEVAKMSVEDLIADVQKQLQSFTAGDDIDLSATTDEGKYKPIHIIQESAYDDIDDYFDETDTTEEAIDRLMPLITEEEEALPDFKKMTPVEAFEYVWGVINQDKYLGISCPEAEPIISKDPELAFYYAVSIINKDKNLGIPWPEAERVNGGLKDSPKWAFYYVRDVLNQGADKRHIEKGIRWLGCEEAIITDETATAMYAKDIAKMPVDEFVAEVKSRKESISHRDDEDFSDTTEEAIDRLMPLIREANRKDYWGRRKEFKEFYPISNWLDKAINRLKARFRGAYTPKFEQSIMALKAKADEYREKGAKNFEIGSDMFSSKEPYPPKDVLDDSTIPSSIKSLLVGAFHDEESKLNKEYEKSLADKWEHDWPAPIHKKHNSIQYDLRRRLQDERIKNRKELAKHKDTYAQDDADLSEIHEE